MSTDPNQQAQDDQAAQDGGDEQAQGATGDGYSVTDLPEGAQPDPLGDASLTAQERAGAGNSDQ